MEISVVVTRHREPDALVHAALRSLVAQEGARGEVLFLDQQRPEGAPEEDPGLSTAGWRLRRMPCPDRGLSHARNLGVARAAHDTVLFLDADARARPGWAAGLGAALAEPGVGVAGSRILPDWPAGGPPLLARSRVVRDQFSIYDLGGERREVARVVGAGFGLRRDRWPAEMRFDEALGRRGGRLFGGEESDLCRRVRAAGGRVLYDGRAAIDHTIPPERTRIGWIWTRLYHSGMDRARLGGAPAPSHPPGLADWMLLPLILPPYAAGWLAGRLARADRDRPPPR